MQIDPFRLRARSLLRFVVRPDKENALAVGDDRLGVRLGFVAGVDVAVEEEEIGWFAPPGRREQD